MLIDTHCHLDALEFAPDRADVMARAHAAGVETLVVPAITAATFAETVNIARQFDCLFALGMHPAYLYEHQDHHLVLLREWVERELPVAIGEIGLDFFVSGLDPVRQMSLFIEQLKIARDFDLPVLLHVRRSQDQVLKALRQIGVKGGIAHAFNGSRQQADAFIKLGFKLGFGGAMTYPRALNIRRLATELPLEAIVLETDAPDMSPEWISKQRNEPGELPRIAAMLAGLRNMTVDEVVVATGINAGAILNFHTFKTVARTVQSK
ncbi:MAG: TatD family hydrolase [Formivibrio sp.]|nr:TatD family hydrolase [Formivibrio sp.]